MSSVRLPRQLLSQREISSDNTSSTVLYKKFDISYPKFVIYKFLIRNIKIVVEDSTLNFANGLILHVL